MRHRKRGRRLGRSSSHRLAMRRNLASSLFLTERDSEYDDNAPKVKGRIVTTLQKAKEVRPLVEKCITIARRSLQHQDAAEKLATTAERGSDEWKRWRQSSDWQDWNQAMAPVVAARRRALQLLGDKEAVSILFDEVAPRFADRNGGYTRVLRVAQVRLGDAGQQAILEFVGVHDRVSTPSERPAFADDEAPADDESPVAEDDVAEEAEAEADVDEDSEGGENASDESAEAEDADEAGEKKGD